MKNYTFLPTFLSLFFSCTFFLANAVTLPITNVTVYRNQATVVRSGETAIASGENYLSFDNLPLTLDRSTLQFDLGEDVQLIAMDWKQEKNEVKILPEIKLIKDSIALLDIEKKIINSGLEMLKLNRDLGPASDRAREEELRLLANYSENKERELRIKLIKVGSQINRLNKRLQEIRSKNNDHQPKEYLSLQIQCFNNAGPTRKDVRISYLVSGASWTTIYDLKMKELDQALDLEYRGQVTNNTGESWKDVQLSLSTGLPAHNLQVNPLHPWWLREMHYGDYGDYMISAEVDAEESQVRNFRPNQQQHFIDGQRVRNTPSSFQEDVNVTIFDLKQKKTVPTHKGTKTFTLLSQSVDADYYYLARPKITKNIYLIARAKNWDQLMLSQGYINTFIKGKFQGKSYLDPSRIEEDLEFSLGVDRGLTIDRKSLAEFRENKVLRTRKRASRAWQISIRNNKSKAARIRLEDQVPLSASEQIHVENIKLDGAKLDKEKGMVTWDFDLKAKETAKKVLSYEVEFPKDWNVQI